MTFKADEHLMKLKGSDYLPAVWRVVWFREDHPDGQIDTEVVFWDHDKQEIMVRATVVAPKTGARATAHCLCSLAEFKNGYCEKAETQAVGRALALLGYGTAFAGQDMEEGARPAEAPASVARNGSAHQVPPPAQAPASKEPRGFVQAAAAALAHEAPRQQNQTRTDDDALLAGLRAEVVALLEHDGAALDLLRAKGTLPPDMSAEQLRKAKGWLLERERRNVPLSVRLGRAIDEATTPEALRGAQEAVQNAKDSKGVSQAEYVSLLRDAERRRTELSGPLTAGAHIGRHRGSDADGSAPRSAQASGPS